MSEATRTPPPTPYDAAFYAQQSDGSLRSAQVVVPLVMDLIRPASVLDVGCGVGTWLCAFAENGVADVLGLDGDYVNRADLRIPAEQFRAADLTRPPNLGRTFDLAACLEVGEHLPKAAAPGLVALLTTAAPFVLFGRAAPPGRNEPHQRAVAGVLARSLFGARVREVDPFRPRIWRDRRVNWWYQQNLFLYVRETELAVHPALREEHELAKVFPFELLHDRVSVPLFQPPGLGAIVRGFPGAVWRAVRRRLF